MNRAILVKSCQKNRARQTECIAWLQDVYAHGVPGFFIEGGHYQRQGIDRSCLRVASGDEYGWNSIKLQLALGLLIDSISIDRLFICDDDTFVHPRRWLAHEPTGDLECRIFRHPNGDLPWVHGGGGWWMSRRMCELYVEQCKERTSGDDVVVARIAQANGIEMVDRPDLYAGDRYSGHNHRVAADNAFITSHHVQPDEMRSLYEATREL